MQLDTNTRVVRRATHTPAWHVDADICIVGAGISGTSAALEAAALGRKVVLVDSLPALGGQAVNSIIGTFCGLFSNGPKRFQVTHGIADGILRDLGAQGALHYKEGPLTTVVLYDEIALSRWIEQKILDAGITVILGAVIGHVAMEGRRVQRVTLATRYGDVHVDAKGFVDASGDAALAWNAGLACREPITPVHGTQMVVLEGLDETHAPTPAEFKERVASRANAYGLERKDGLVFYFRGRNIGIANMTHIETPLEPVAASHTALVGRDQADRAFEFLRTEYPEVYRNARIRSYGLPGIRQTRWIVGTHTLSAEEVIAAKAFPDAVARTSWPIELHDRPEGYVWQPFGDDHLHTVPLGSLLAADADNVIAAGRCIDADSSALSSVRVMGPCIAMGAAAAHVLDMAGAGSVHDIDRAALRERIADNVDRIDPPHLS
ncbi:FAD-dependent oxidoreductase [Pandoraea apista]|uniref:FAD-dependent oxidoreductase n=1 Tax=Pandoraea apista TaxID=93218 RepID=A0A0B5F1D1_9BURK|nr:FAD-dependent oxidoreductase [Pandoraea apista]AKH71106.1 FAD-dependent oxidoreductase [Pandoraea apista]AKI63377.1 FAD-dependent oxidoreductase [Pandoraea apista]ALS67517.1 FAD-dependent oxidoreductase [Pandoraea apista]AVF41751.1 FAD-dependent oxidoreductase [Pandoraea apista]